MKGLATKIFSVALCLAAGMFGQVKGNWCCFDGIEMGADYLYWQSCNGDMEYAVESLDETSVEFSTTVKTKHLPSNWDSGYRIYGAVDKLWCDLKGALVYTSFNTKSHRSLHNDANGSLLLTTGTPVGFPSGTDVSAKWKLEYRCFDAILGYPLQVSCDSCFHVEAFSGLKWLNIEQHRHDKVSGTASDVSVDASSLKRHLDVSGIGPMFGINASYTLFDCIKTIGMVGGSLIVADSHNHDHFKASGGDFEVSIDQKYKSHSECVCFPGVHLMSGLTYETCICNMEIGLRLGWEYVQWIGAPDFPFYENGDLGVRSSVSEKNLSFQGIFAGANITF